MKLHLLLCALPAVFGFSNTAPFYGLDAAVLGKSHLVRVAEIDEIIATTKSLCSGASQNHQQLLLCRVANLKYDVLLYLYGGNKAAIDNVYYGSSDNLELPGLEECSSASISYSQGKLPEAFDNYKINVIDVESEDQLAAITAEFKEKVQQKSIVWIQGIPASVEAAAVGGIDKLVKVAEAAIEDAKQAIADIDIDTFKVASKAKRNDESDLIDEIASEVEDDFKAAESYILNGGDELVHILDSDNSTTVGGKKGKGKKQVSNLFTNYQFFTPGLLLCLVVSFFLVFVLYVAISWLSALEISYKSFDKQVDYEKKTE